MAIGTAAIAGDVESGRAQLWYTRPVPRHLILRGRLVFWLFAQVCVVVAGVAGGVLASLLSDSLGREGAEVAIRAGVQFLPLALFVGALSFAVSAFAPTRARALGRTLGIAFLGYLANFVSLLWSAAEPLRWITPFGYYDPLGVVQGIRWRDAVVLTVAASVLVVVAHAGVLRAVRRHLREEGYLLLPGLVPRALVDQALRAINASRRSAATRSAKKRQPDIAATPARASTSMTCCTSCRGGSRPSACNPASPAIQVGASDRTFDVTGLVGNWLVRWRIQACNLDGCSAWIDGPGSSTPNPGSAPAAPSNLRVCGTSGDPYEVCLANRIALHWTDNATNEERYEFQWSIAQIGTPPWNNSWSTAVLPANALPAAWARRNGES